MCINAIDYIQGFRKWSQKYFCLFAEIAIETKSTYAIRSCFYSFYMQNRINKDMDMKLTRISWY